MKVLHRIFLAALTAHILFILLYVLVVPNEYKGIWAKVMVSLMLIIILTWIPAKQYAYQKYYEKLNKSTKVSHIPNEDH